MKFNEKIQKLRVLIINNFNLKFTLSILVKIRIAVFTVCVYAILDLIQLIKRKSIIKVDNCILLLVVLYIIALMLHFLFKKIIIYRPNIL